MPCSILLSIVFLYFGVCQSDATFVRTDWTYTNKDWGGICKTGQRQSPIDISMSDAVIDCAMDGLKFVNYDRQLEHYEVTNNGRTAQFTLGSKSGRYAIVGGGLGDEYELAQVHFHWSSTDSIWRGSEHRLSTNSYPLEAHFVHVKKGKTLKEALDDPTGLAVVGSLFTEVAGDEHDKDGIDTLALSPIIREIKRITESSTKLEAKEKIDLTALLPTNRASFYRYNGSLTTPPCSEAVVWTLLTNPVPIHTNQLNAMRMLVDDQRQTMNNYRPTQPLNGRTVKLVREQCLVVGHVSSSTSIWSSTTLLLIAYILI